MRVEQLRVQNYRVLQDVSFKALTNLVVLSGPNGSGKSTVIDVFAFLHEAFTTGLRGAWDARNRMGSIRSRGHAGPVCFELKYRAEDAQGRNRLVTYRLEIEERKLLPVVAREILQWNTSPGQGRPRTILEFSHGKGTIYDEESGRQQPEELSSPDLLAVSALGQFRQHPRVKVLRDFIQGWYLSYITAQNTRTTPNVGPEPRLSQTGDNLANVIQYLQENDPGRLARIFRALSERIPQLESVLPSQLDDGRLLLRLKDAPFEEPVLAKFASDGTLKLLAYLVILMGAEPPHVVGIEEPENQLHPQLVPILAEEIRELSGTAQVFVTTHSREFLHAVQPAELWMISRGDDGYARVRQASDDDQVMAMIKAGATLSSLWSEGYLQAADPLP